MVEPTTHCYEEEDTDDRFGQPHPTKSPDDDPRRKLRPLSMKGANDGQRFLMPDDACWYLHPTTVWMTVTTTVCVNDDDLTTFGVPFPCCLTCPTLIEKLAARPVTPPSFSSSIDAILT